MKKFFNRFLDFTLKHYAGILVAEFVLLCLFIAACSLEYLFLPKHICGAEYFSDVKLFVYYNLLENALMILTFIIFLVIAAQKFYFLYESNKNIREMGKILKELNDKLDGIDSAHEAEERISPPKKSIWKKDVSFIMLIVIIILSIIAAAARAIHFFDNIYTIKPENTGTAGHIRTLNEISKDEKEGKTITRTFDKVDFYYISKGHSPMYHFTASRNGEKMIFALGKKDYKDFEDEKSHFKNAEITITYFENSHIIKDWEMSGDILDSAIQSKEDVEKYLPKVEVKFDGENLVRPENMNKYGAIVWVVTDKNGRLVHTQADNDRPFTLIAVHYSKINVKENHFEPGEYTAQLHKLVTTKDEQGLYRNYHVYPISNTVTFTCQK